MPQVMTEEQAETKTCPFMTRRTTRHHEGVSDEAVGCLGSACACWGWVDPEEGEIDRASPERTKTPIGATIKGPGWEKEYRTIESQMWIRYPVIGPRRGKCEAMSPEIIVETS